MYYVPFKLRSQFKLLFENTTRRLNGISLYDTLYALLQAVCCQCFKSFIPIALSLRCYLSSVVVSFILYVLLQFNLLLLRFCHFNENLTPSGGSVVVMSRLCERKHHVSASLHPDVPA